MMRRALTCLLLLLLVACSAARATNTYFFSGDSEGNPGDTVSIVVEGENDDEIKGYSIHFRFDPAVFDYVSSTIEGTRGEGASLPTLSGTDSSATAGVVYSFSCPPAIPPGTGPFLIVTLEIQPDAPVGTTYLDLRDGDPQPLNRLTPCPGGSLTPLLVDGAFEVLGEQPACFVDPIWLDFGNVAVDSFAELSFTIQNTGGGVLAGTVSEVCEGFSIAAGGGPYELAAGELQEVTVRFEPPEAGDYLCTVETGTELCEDVDCEGRGDASSGIGEQGQGRLTGPLCLSPNPSCGPVTIRFSLRSACATRLAVYDLGGRMVRMLVRDILPMGPQSFIWEGVGSSGNPLPAGVYYLRLSAAGETISTRVTTLD